MLPAADGVADRDDFPDEIIQVHAAGQEAGGVVGGVAVVAVEGDVVHVLVALVEHGVFPVAVSRHVVGGAAAGDQLDGGVDPLHDLGGLVGYAAVLVGSLVADLPGTVHLVAQTPELDPQRVLRAVFDPQVGPVAAALVVGVLDDVAGRVRAAGAEVHRVHDGGVRRLRPVAELMQANLVGLGGEPGQVQALRPLVPRADGILPVEAGDEVAAGIADDRNAELPDHFNDVAAEAVLIRGGMGGLIDAAVDRAAQVLDEGAVHAGVDLADREVFVQDHGGFFHVLLPPSINHISLLSLDGSGGHAFDDELLREDVDQQQGEDREAGTGDHQVIVVAVG